MIVLNDVSLNTVTAPLNSSALPSKSFTLDHFKKLMNLVREYFCFSPWLQNLEL